MERRANIAASGLLIGLIATIIVGAIGVAISVRVSNKDHNISLYLPFTKNNGYEDVIINADKGKLYFALENCESKTNSYKVNFKAKKSGVYSQIFSGNIKGGELYGYKYVDKTSGWTKKYFRVFQRTNLSNKASHVWFYAKVV